MEDLGCFAAVTDGFHASLVHQELMTGLRPVGHTRVFIDVITPNAGGLTPEKWRKDATICPQHWPTDLSLLCGWYRNDTLEAFAAESYTRLQRQHMFSDLSVDLTALSQRIFYESACRYVPIDALKEQMAKKFFYTRGLKKVVDQPTMLAHHAAQTSLRQRAQAAPLWGPTLRMTKDFTRLGCWRQAGTSDTILR